MGNIKVDSSCEFVYENRIKSRGEAEKLSPEICKNKALGRELSRILCLIKVT